MLDKERQYTAIYFPEDMLEKKDIAYLKLMDIDSNWSKVIQGLLDSVIEVATEIARQGKNYRHFNFEIVAFDKLDDNNVITVKEKNNGKEKGIKEGCNGK